MINLIIKGNLFDAVTAAHARGVAFVSAEVFSGSAGDWASRATVDDTALDAVRIWFMADDGPAPYPAGALLFYSDAPAAPDPRLAWFDDDAAVRS
jgi:hypothetical protein